MNNILDYRMFEYNKNNMGEVLYHFIDQFALEHMLETDSLSAGNNDLREIIKGKYALSLTRRFDFPWKSIRLAIDHRSLAHNYRIVPVHFYNAGGTEDGHDYRDLSHPYNKGHQARFGKDFRNQYEMRLITNTNSNIPLDRYLLGVDICIDDSKVLFPTRYYEDYTPEMQAEAISKSFDVPVTIVDTFKPFPYYPIDQKYTKVRR